MNKPFFEIGRHVKHKLGTQTMVVIEYQEVMGRIKLGPYPQQNRNPEYTGSVLCGWVDEKNFPQRHYYNEAELEAVG